MFILATDLNEDMTVTNAAEATSYRKVRIFYESINSLIL